MNDLHPKQEEFLNRVLSMMYDSSDTLIIPHGDIPYEFLSGAQFDVIQESNGDFHCEIKEYELVRRVLDERQYPTVLKTLLNHLREKYKGWMNTY